MLPASSCRLFFILHLAPPLALVRCRQSTLYRGKGKREGSVTGRKGLIGRAATAVRCRCVWPPVVMETCCVAGAETGVVVRRREPDAERWRRRTLASGAIFTASSGVVVVNGGGGGMAARPSIPWASPGPPSGERRARYDGGRAAFSTRGQSLSATFLAASTAKTNAFVVRMTRSSDRGHKQMIGGVGRCSGARWRRRLGAVARWDGRGGNKGEEQCVRLPVVPGAAALCAPRFF